MTVRSTLTTQPAVRMVAIALVVTGCSACSGAQEHAIESGESQGAAVVEAAPGGSAVDSEASPEAASDEGAASIDPAVGEQPATGDNRCDQIALRFAERLEAAPGTCRRDADCETYASGIGMCDGVTDRAAARALGIISTEYYGTGCHATVRCAAHVLDPACFEGTCRNRVDLPSRTATDSP